MTDFRLAQSETEHTRFLSELTASNELKEQEKLLKAIQAAREDERVILLIYKNV